MNKRKASDFVKSGAFLFTNQEKSVTIIVVHKDRRVAL